VNIKIDELCGIHVVCHTMGLQKAEADLKCDRRRMEMTSPDKVAFPEDEQRCLSDWDIVKMLELQWGNEYHHGAGLSDRDTGDVRYRRPFETHFLAAQWIGGR
jgi:hypothetical protein